MGGIRVAGGPPAAPAQGLLFLFLISVLNPVDGSRVPHDIISGWGRGIISDWGRGAAGIRMERPKGPLHLYEFPHLLWLKNYG